MTQFSKIALFGLLICGHPLFAKSNTFVPTTIPDSDPEIERKSIKLDDKFEINLFACDPMLEKPIQINWDAKGRLWCATSQTYPQLVPGQIPNDKVVILEDTTGSGKADKSTVFADGLFMPNAVIPGDGGAYVTNSTEIDFLKDTKGTGKADQRRVVLAGFGTEDTHHIVHTLHWGVDGRLYFLQSIYIHSHLETPQGLKTLLGSGVWRFDTRTLDLDVYSRGLVNPWGILWNRWGQTFETDGAGGEGINYAFPGAGFFSAVGMEKLMKGLNPGSPKYASEEILSGGNIPDDYQGDILTNDFRANRIVRFKLSDNGAGYVSKQMPDFITSTDPAFRPIDIKMGPDGAIYIADWYNPIIQHGEVDFRDPRRDHTHGRIWRITAKNRPLVPRPQIDGASIAQLFDFLKAPEDWTRNQARLALRERDPKDVMPAMKSWLRKIKSSDPQADHDRLEALWVCENINTVDPQLLERVLKSDDPQARAAAVRVVGHWAGQLEDASKLLESMVKDSYPRVRLEAIRALAQVPVAHSMVVAARALDLPADPYIEYALWLTSNDLQSVWLPAFEAGKLTDWEKPDQLSFALQAVKSPLAVKTLVEQLKNGQTPPDARAGVIQLIANIGSAQDADVLFDLAITNQMKDAATQAELLSALFSMSRKQPAPPTNPERLKDLMEDPDDSVRAEAYPLAGAWKLQSLRPQLIEAAQAPQTSNALRSAAIKGLAAMADPQSIAELRKLSSAPTPANIRHAAIAGVAVVNLKDAANRVAIMLAAGDSDPGTLVAPFLDRERGPAMLAASLAGKKIPTDTAKLALRYLRGTTTIDPKLTEIFSTAAGTASGPIRLSPDEMKQTVDEVIAKGDPANGERVFRRLESSCYLCHSIDGAGGWLAPDLSSIGGSSQVDYLINSVLDPGKDIKDGFDGIAVVTKSGDVVTGIKIGQDLNNLILRDNAHQEIRIPLSDIKSQKSIGSLMPNGLTDTMTHQEFVDLVKFLSQLGKPGPYASSPTQYVRRWRVMDAQPGESSSAIPKFANQEGAPVYSMVSGELPPDAIAAKGGSTGFVRAGINVTSAGKIRLVLNDPKGLRLWVDDKPMTITGDETLDVSVGLHQLTFSVDSNQRGNESLRIEVADVPGSTGHAQPVGGK
jgi:putative heme-binding domain-containing protein